MQIVCTFCFKNWFGLALNLLKFFHLLSELWIKFLISHFFSVNSPFLTLSSCFPSQQACTYSNSETSFFGVNVKHFPNWFVVSTVDFKQVNAS